MSEDPTADGAAPSEPRSAPEDRPGNAAPTAAASAPVGTKAQDDERTQALPTADGGQGRDWSREGRHAGGAAGSAQVAEGRYGGDRTGEAVARPRPAAEATGAPTTVLPSGAGRPARPGPPRADRGVGEGRPAAPRSRPAGRRRARLVVQRVDPWSVFLFSLVASICLGVVLLAAVTALYAALSALGVLSSLNGVLGEVAGTGTPDEVVEPFITSGRVLGATAVLAAVDVVLLTALATLGALLYNLCASLTGGIEVQLGERE